ncbi:hypothetical protein V5799_024687 [Amblyomma americanum]|uniref:Uncharacterized protein n=1 Tax=Amblyomma americanum TaxID=6943 RepID=A0AAQ4EBC3_AMBAM
MTLTSWNVPESLGSRTSPISSAGSPTALRVVQELSVCQSLSVRLSGMQHYTDCTLPCVCGSRDHRGFAFSCPSKSKKHSYWVENSVRVLNYTSEVALYRLDENSCTREKSIALAVVL